MNQSKQTKLHQGVLGRFWLLTNDEPLKRPVAESDALQGQVQIVDDMVRIRVQEPPTPMSTLGDIERAFTLSQGAEPAPDWIYGVTEIGDVLMPVVNNQNRRRSMFGTQPSVRSFRGPALVAGMPQPFGPRATRVSSRIPHADWAGLDPMTRELSLDKQHRVGGLTLTLRATGPLDCGKVGSLELSLSGSWNHADDEPGERTSVSTGLAITTTSKRPRNMQDHVRVVMAVQDLVSLAYDDFLPAYSSSIVCEGGEPAKPIATWLHHGDLLGSPFLGRHWKRGEEEKYPLFTLKDLAGPRAVSRWVQLNLDFPDAANAIRVRFRGPTSPTRRIMELGAAIEQYVSTCTKNAKIRKAPVKWAKVRPPSLAIAYQAGDSFTEFVGDPKRWANAFHNAYINEKHLAGNRQQASDITALCSSAQILLIITLLNRAAGTKQPGKTILADHRVQPLGTRIRQLIGA